MSGAGPRRPLSPGDRFAAWVVTGPVGRIAAFFAELGAYWWRRLRERRNRP